ncbi:MAG: hypothetical protein Q9195_008357 [Heterodermia aff. obscurata]
MTECSTLTTDLAQSIGCCLAFVLIAYNGYQSWSSLANGAQGITLALAVFDEQGRLMVSPEGIVPCRRIANSKIESSFDGTFDTDNDIFTWMYRLSHRWSTINAYLPSYRSGIRRKTINEKATADHPTAFKLLFCVTASELAKMIKVELQDLGTLFVEIMQTGTVRPKKFWALLKMNKKDFPRRYSLERAPGSGANGFTFGRGQMLWLIRRVTKREVGRLQTVGYRFADLSKIGQGLSDALEVSQDDLTQSLAKMYSVTGQKTSYEFGVHVVCFALRPVWQRSFDVLAQKDHRNLLPSIKLTLPKLDDCHLEYLHDLDGKTVGYCLSILPSQPAFKNPEEEAFAAEFLASVHHLAANIGKKWFLKAKLIAKPFLVSNLKTASHLEVEFATLISFRVMANTHDYTNFNNLYQYIPRNFFMASQNGRQRSWGNGRLARHISGLDRSVDRLSIPASISSIDQYTDSSQRNLVPNRVDWPKQTHPGDSTSPFDMDVIGVRSDRAYLHGLEYDTMDLEMMMEKLLIITITERRPVDPDDSEAWP